MKKAFLALVILSAAPLAGCGVFSAATHVASGDGYTPATYASKTKVDEQAIITAEQGYKAFRLAVTVGVNADIIHGPRAAQLADLDNKLYAGLQAMEKAYAAGNAASFAAALVTFNQFLAQANALTGGKD